MKRASRPRSGAWRGRRARRPAWCAPARRNAPPRQSHSLSYAYFLGLFGGGGHVVSLPTSFFKIRTKIEAEVMHIYGLNRMKLSNY